MFDSMDMTLDAENDINYVISLKIFRNFDSFIKYVKC